MELEKSHDQMKNGHYGTQKIRRCYTDVSKKQTNRRVTNHWTKNLIKVYKQMGGRKIRNVNGVEVIPLVYFLLIEEIDSTNVYGYRP